jgi:hypothetical protein
MVDCPHYLLGYQHAQKGITIDEALKQKIAPTTTNEYNTCGCYHYGHFQWRKFRHAAITKKDHDPQCTCGSITAEQTQQ